MRLIALAAAVLLAAAPALSAPAMLMPAPPVTEASQVFGDPALPGTPEAAELAARGYVREEVFLAGEANIYGYGPDGKVRVEQAGVPYVTRAIVIRPRDPKRFNGEVQLNPFHPVNGQGVWDGMKDYVLAKGAAYVGVMIGGDANTRNAPPSAQGPLAAPLALKWFDATRYAAIAWPDDDGIRWDVFAEAAESLRRPDGPMRGLKVERVYASGWSFTGSFLRTFINEGFHDALRDSRGRPLIDGYLIGISSSSFRSGYVPINSRAAMPEPEDPRRRNRAIDVPVIELMSENEAITNREPQTPDSDGVRRHRLYEVPGLTHGSGGAARTNVVELQRARRLGGAPGRPADTCPFANTDVDMADFSRAALDNLDRWARAGTPAPRVPRMQVDAQFRQVRDADGNALGGLRPAQLEVPLARYGEPPGGQCAPRQGLGSPSIQMRRIPLPAARLRTLYPGGAKDYLARFDSAVDGLQQARFLRPSDAAAQKAAARRAAAAAFASSATE